MNEKTLNSTALGMVAQGRGILAADESTSTIGKRFDGIKVENTEENRRAYRDLLFSAKGAEQYTSGVIFYEETLFQKAADGTPIRTAIHNSINNVGNLHGEVHVGEFKVVERKQ